MTADDDRGGHDRRGGAERQGPADPFASVGSLFGDGAPTTSVRRSWSPTDPPSPPLTVWRVLGPFLALTAGSALAVRFL